MPLEIEVTVEVLNPDGTVDQEATGTVTIETFGDAPPTDEELEAIEASLGLDPTLDPSQRELADGGKMVS